MNSSERRKAASHSLYWSQAIDDDREGQPQVRLCGEEQLADEIIVLRKCHTTEIRLPGHLAGIGSLVRGPNRAGAGSSPVT